MEYDHATVLCMICGNFREETDYEYVDQCIGFDASCI